jgi:hypothetical protein
MTISALFATTLTLALGAGLPAALPHGLDGSEPEVIVIDDLGMQNVPTQWFADTVVVPGDSGERTILLQNGRAETTTVTVALTDFQPPTDQSLLSDLRLHWNDSAASVAEVAASAPVLADEVVLSPGERLPLTLGYDYGYEATRIPTGTQPLTFTITITAIDPGAGNGQGSSDGEANESDARLATTGGELTPWWLWALLSTLVGWWLIASRRSRKKDAEERTICEGAALRADANTSSQL